MGLGRPRPALPTVRAAKQGPMGPWDRTGIEMTRIHKRKVDELRRVVIPQQMLNGINVKPGELVDITCEGGSVRIEKSVPTCWLCGSDENLVEVEVEDQNCMICSRCVLRIQMALLRRQQKPGKCLTLEAAEEFAEETEE